jgi:pimeloyl-ACP methyl ester carboxylesterase
MPGMPRLDIEGAAVDYEITGAGHPVVLLHARPFVSWYAPLVGALSGCSVLQYRRTLRRDASEPAFGIDEDADICARLLGHVGFDFPHLVGHSYGGLLALALARHDAVQPRSLALLEPAARGFLEPEQASAGLAPLMQAYRSGGGSGAIDLFLRAVCGDGYRAVLERLVPGALDDAFAHAEQFFELELPAVVHWRFAPGDVAGGDQPILNVVGAETVARFRDGAELIQSWYPESLRYELPGAGHLLMAQQPAAMARRLAEFWA